MIINNAKVYRNGHFESASIEFDSHIRSFSPGEGMDACGAYIIPGLIDVHTHGAMGIDASDCTAEQIHHLAQFYSDNGVTSFCFTTLTVPADELRGAMKNIRAYERFGGEAKCAGVHLEGPFVSRGKCGAQNPDNILKPDIALFNELNELSGGMVRLITVAPEVEGALDFIREASKVCTVSLGHSTADYDQAMAGFEAGATHVTHLFNGMEPFHHRKPGLVGAALTAGANVELICDGVHIHPAMILAVHKMFGDRLIIVSDSLRCAGLCDGRYNLGGLPMIVRDGRATLLDGTIAGSSSNLLQELRNVVSYGVPLEVAVKAMTETPAKDIGVFDSIGSLETGKCADFLVLNKELKLMATFIDGKLVNGTTDFASVK